MPTTRKPTPVQARKAALESDLTPLYAVAGLTDAVATTVKTTLVTTRGRAVTEIQDRTTAWEKQAKATTEELDKFLRSLPAQVRALPETTRSRIAQAQKRSESLLVEAGSTYADLAGRGKLAVDGSLVVARKLSNQAEKRAEDVLSDVADRVDPAFEKVQETVTVARKTVTGRTATETVTSRTAAKAAANRAVAASADEARTEARRAAAKRAAATRAARKAADEAAAQKAAAKRAAATRAARKAADQAAAQKATADQVAAPKVTASAN